MFAEAFASMGATIDVAPCSFSSNSITADLLVCLGASLKTQETDQRISNIDKRLDIILSVSAFETAFGAGIRPRENDSCVIGDVTYRVKPLSGSDPAWRYSDSYKVRMRIHLLEIT